MYRNAQPTVIDKLLDLRPTASMTSLMSKLDTAMRINSLSTWNRFDKLEEVVRRSLWLSGRGVVAIAILPESVLTRRQAI